MTLAMSDGHLQNALSPPFEIAQNFGILQSETAADPAWNRTLSNMILSVAQMKAADEAAVRQGLGMDRLMLRAGRAVADVVGALVGAGQSIAVLCGPGNNGGDGYVAARILAERGFTVDIYADRAPRIGTEAARARAQWLGRVSPFKRFETQSYGLAIDALYGAGLSRPVEGEEAMVVAKLNAASLPVIAIDLPSGLHGDTGAETGPCIAATRTVTFFRLKPGHLLLPGRTLCGQVTVADIGLTEAHLQQDDLPLSGNTPELWRSSIIDPEIDTHKYRRGHCLVVSGPELQTGASRLAAIAALQAGAGAVTIAGARDALRIHAAHLTAIMLREAETPADFAALLERRFKAVIIGPAAGAGEQTLARIAAILHAAIPLVIDADGLTSLMGQLETVRARVDGKSPLVMTPHSGEFERLFASNLMDDLTYVRLGAGLRASKVEKARAAARLTGAVIVFKGADTVIAAPDGRAAINDNAGPQLATAGSGDVLAGIVGSHLAQGMPGFEAAASAVWLHGRLGEILGKGLTADQLAASVKPVGCFVTTTCL